MPRRKNADEGGGPAPKPRVRKKKEPVNPGGTHTPSLDGMKIEPGFEHHAAGLANPPPPQMHMGEEGPPFGAQPDFFYHYPMQSGYGHPGMPPPPHHHHPPPGQMPAQQFVEPQEPASMQPAVPPPPSFMYTANGQPPPPGGVPQFMLRQQLAHSNMPQPPFLEYRLQEMNRRLYSFHNSQYTLNQADHAQWWEAFAHEFFDDDAQMTIALFDVTDMVPRKYTIGRLLIPRFYRKIFDNGVREMFYIVRTPAQERINPQRWGMCALDCENVLMVTRHDRPIPSEVHTECRLFVEFSPFEESVGYRIRHWAIELRTSSEFYRMPKDGSLENSPEFVKSGITRSGLPQEALHYLKMCLILEPMQIIMHHSKSTSAPPQQTLRTILFNQRRTQQQHNAPLPQGMLNEPSLSVPVTPTEEPGTKKPARKRTRKTTTNSTVSNSTIANPSPKKKGGAIVAANIQSPPPPQNMQQNFVPNPNAFNQIMYQQDVLVVGEPSMMGCEFGEDDERAISRIENSQYNPDSQQGIPPNHLNSGTSMAQPLLSTHSSGLMPPSQMLGNPVSGLPPMNADAAQMFLTDFGELQQQSAATSGGWGPGVMASTTNS